MTAPRPPLRYEFMITQMDVGMRVQGAHLSLWTRNGSMERVLTTLMRDARIRARFRGLVPKRTACVVEGSQLRCFVFTA